LHGPYVDDSSNIFPEAILGRAKEDKVVDITVHAEADGWVMVCF
jgi:hypothetical protein